MKSYTVIGGGLAGLTAANALAGNGDRVRLFEQSERLGGRAITQKQQGYLLNLGPHALYRGGAAKKTFEEWKVPFTGTIPDVRQKSHLVFEGRKYPFFTGLAGLMRSPLLSFREKFEAARILQLLTTGQAESGLGMDEWVRRHARSERVRQIAATIIRVTTYVHNLERMSAQKALARASTALRYGVLYVDDGWQTLVDGLAERARSLGVEISCGEPAGSLDSIDADGIILATPPTSVETLARRTLPKMEPVRMACLTIGLRSLPPGAGQFALGLDQPFYLSAHSNWSRLAPGGKALVHVGKYSGTDDRGDLERFTDLVIPGWREEADLVQFLPNMTVTHAMPSIYGGPDIDALGMDRVAIAGDWVGGEGMLADAAVSSALRAAAMIQRGTGRAAHAA
jgi:protoporphyrinogen oxidase